MKAACQEVGKFYVSTFNQQDAVQQAINDSNKNIYVQSAALNGKVYDKNYLDHFDILKGGTFQLKMGSGPNKQKGTQPDDYPYSFSEIHNK